METLIEDHLPKIKNLTDTELEVFVELGKLKTGSQIAKERGLSDKTIHTHCRHIKTKFKTENLMEIRMIAVDFIKWSRQMKQAKEEMLNSESVQLKT